MFSSDLLKQGTASPTTRVAAVSGVATTNYTPTTPVEISIIGIATTGESISVSGVVVYQGVAGNTSFERKFYAGQGQLQSIASTGLSSYVISARKID